MTVPNDVFNRPKPGDGKPFACHTVGGKSAEGVVLLGPDGEILEDLGGGGDGLTDAQLRASPVPVSGPLTDAQLRATAVPTSTADGADVTLGAKGNTPATDDTGTWSIVALLKRLLAKIPVIGPHLAAASMSVCTAVDELVALGQSVMATSIPVAIAADQSPIPVTLSVEPAEAVGKQALSDGAFSFSTAIGAKFRLNHVSLKADAPMNQTVQVVRVSREGPEWDVVLVNVDMVNEQDFFFQPDEALHLAKGNEIKVTCTDSGSPTATVYAVIGTEPI